MTALPRRSARTIAALVVGILVGALLTSCVAEDASPQPRPGGTAKDVAAAFADGGIAVVDDASTAWPDDALMASPASAVDVMQSEIDSGGGMPGEDLDELALMPPGAPSFSYLVAAWLVDPATPRARDARTWFPDEVDWTKAPSVWFPRAALLLFVADAMEASIADFGEPAPAGGAAAGVAAASVATVALVVDGAALPQAPCSAVSAFFAKTIDTIFSAVQLPPDFLGGGGVLGDISGFLAALFNTAVALAKKAVVAVIESLTAPVLRAIGAAVAVVGVASHLSSYLLGVSMTLVSSERPVVLDGREGSWFGLVESNRPLEAQLSDCLAVLKQKPLRDVMKAGETVRWRTYLPTKANGYTFERTALSYPALVSTVDGSKRIVLPWVAGTDPASTRPEEIGAVRIRAELPKGDVTEVLQTARTLIDQAVKSIAANGGPLAPAIESAINGILLPLIAQIEREILDQGRSLLMIVGSGSTPFVYREPDVPSPLPASTAPGCYVGSWRFERIVQSRWLDLGRSAFQRFSLDIGPDGSYRLRVVGWAVHDPDGGGFWSAYEGETTYTAAASPDGSWSVGAPRLTASLSTAWFYLPLGNGYSLGKPGHRSAEGLAPSGTGEEFGTATFGAGLRPVAFRCGEDGAILEVTGEADATYGATVWRFRRG